MSEAAVVGVPHDIKGDALYCYVTLNSDVQPSPDIANQLRAIVRQQLGAFASPDFIHW